MAIGGVLKTGSLTFNGTATQINNFEGNFLIRSDTIVRLDKLLLRIWELGFKS